MKRFNAAMFLFILLIFPSFLNAQALKGISMDSLTLTQKLMINGVNRFGMFAKFNSSNELTTPGIADQAVTAAKLANESVTDPTIPLREIQGYHIHTSFVDNSTLEFWGTPGLEGSIRIMDGGVTGNKLAAVTAASGLSKDGSGNYQLNVDGSTLEISADAARVKANGILTSHIADGQIFTSDLHPDPQKFLLGADTTWRRQNNIVMHLPSLSIGRSGTTYTLETTGANDYLILGNRTSSSGFTSIPALPATSVSNVFGITLNISNQDAPTWDVTPVHATKPNIKDRKNRIWVFYNMLGNLYSPIPSLQAQIYKIQNDFPESGITYNEILIQAASDTVTDVITDSLALITDASESNQYILKVLPGVYIESGAGGTGLDLKDYVHLIGNDRENCIIMGVFQPAGNEVFGSTIQTPATCTIQNLTVQAWRTKYPIHCDLSESLFTGTLTVRDCIVRHLGGNDGLDYYDFGAGLRPGQNVVFENCVFLGGGFYTYWKFGYASLASYNLSATVTVKNSTMGNVILYEYVGYNPNHFISLENSTIRNIKYSGEITQYNANPGDPDYNQGYFNSSFRLLLGKGNKIGSVQYDISSTPSTFVLDSLLSGNRYVFAGLNEKAVNRGASQVNQGYAVQLLADTAVASLNPSTYLTKSRVELWDESGILFGFAEDDIAADAIGTVQVDGLPLVYMDGSGSSIVYGDSLEVSSTGTVVKFSGGKFIGWALEAQASTGIKQMRYKNYRW